MQLPSRRFFALSLSLGAVLVGSACGGGGGGDTPTPPPVGRAKWTVLVFLNAASDLFPFSTLNVNQMEQVANNPQVRFVVQWKLAQDLYPTSLFNGTRRYLVKPDSTGQINSQLLEDMGTGVDMGRAQTLKEFIDWGKQAYPADRYVVVVWNHGNGWRRSSSGAPTRGVSYDDQTGNAIQTWQLKQALEGHKHDILAYDASLMQMIEVAYESKDNADFIAGSEESPPGEGYPYQRVFAPFRDNPDATTRQLSKGFVDGMLNEPNYVDRKITQSVVESSKLPAVATAYRNFAQALIANRAALGTAVPQARAAAQSYSPTPNRIYRDMIDFSLELEARTDIASVRTASAAARQAVAAALVWEGHNINSGKSRGLSIDVSDATSFASGSADYARMTWNTDSSWGSWLAVSP